MPESILGAMMLERALDLAKNKYRPPEILELEAQIERETRALEIRESAGGRVEKADISRVVGMKLLRDKLYADWLLRECS